jgi:hypothetical protein
VTWAQVGVLAGVVTLVLTAGQLLLRVLTRPRVTLRLDTEPAYSCVEADGWGYVRLLAHNARFRRAARGARVICDGYRRSGEPRSAGVTFGTPSLGWTSGGLEVVNGALSVPPGVSRSFDLGFLCRREAFDDFQGLTEGDDWMLQLCLHEQRIAGNRDALPPGRWIIRLIATADDAPAITYEVTIEWTAESQTADEALRSVKASIGRV